MKTSDSYEVDFRAQSPTGPAQLIQVCAGLATSETQDRETRALLDAAKTNPRADLRLLTLDSTPLPRALPPASTGNPPPRGFLMNRSADCQVC